MTEKEEIFAKIEEEFCHDVGDALIYLYQHIPYGHMAPLWILRKLKLTSYCEVIHCDKEDLMAHLLRALPPYVNGLESNEIDTVAVPIFSGAMNMNPAMVILKCVEKDIYAVAMAKEGLISQKTAQKALNTIKSHILAGL